MQALAEKGITAYDFLRGASSYKKRLATCENRLIGVQVWRPTLRAATRRSVQLVARVTERGLRSILPGIADR
jgi:CelD/BcsL family acetyltransferase involved in cellulose biosynthesis